MSKRQSYALMGASVCLFVLAVLGAGCAAPIDAARNALTTATRVESEAVLAFRAYNRPHEMDIVAQAKDSDSALRALAVYQAERKKVETAINSLWLATVAAETAIDEAEAGLRSKSDIGGYVAALLRNVSALKDALVVLGVPLGGL